jgi:hypothetical protein
MVSDIMIEAASALLLLATRERALAGKQEQRAWPQSDGFVRFWDRTGTREKCCAMPCYLVLLRG